MNTLEQEILQRVRHLAPENQRRVLVFLEQLEQEQPLSARELMQLPAEERRQRVQAAIDLAAAENFEIFEAYSEEDDHAE